MLIRLCVPLLAAAAILLAASAFLAPDHESPSVLPAAAAATATLSVTPPAPAPAPSRPDVLLITLDTTRADALGCYGASGDPTPHLDALARRGVRFTHAEAPTPITLPSHASLFSGLYPPEHGVRDNSPHALPTSVPLVQEAYKRAGYTTAAFVSAAPLAPRWGLDRGFSLYNFRPGERALGTPLSPAERKGGDTVSIASRWLKMIRKVKGRAPFFLWVHLFDPHHPYEPPERFKKRFGPPHYAGEVAYADDCAGTLLDALGGHAARDETVIVVTADHGESLGQHDEDTHAHLIFRATRHVPLIFHAPSRWPGSRAIDTPVSLVDIAPTLYHLIDAKPPRHSGRTLLRALESERETLDDQALYGESLYDFVHFGWAPLYAVRQGRWHLVEADDALFLYDVVRDPGEKHDRSAAERSITRRLARRLDAIRDGFTKPHAARGARQAGPAGYLQGSAAEPMLARDRKRRGKRPIPMDVVSTVRSFEKAKNRTITPTAFAQRRALVLLDALIERDPENPAFHYWRGRAKRNLVVHGKREGPAALRVLDEAVAAFDACLARRPDHVGAESLAMQCLVMRWAHANDDGTRVLDRARRTIASGRETEMTLIGRAEVLLAPGRHHDLEAADRTNRECGSRFGHTPVWRRQREKIDTLVRRAALKRLKRKVAPPQPAKRDGKQPNQR